MKNFFLLTTEHLEDALWFRCDDDFKVGMNYVAVVAALFPYVDVLAFILMSNHVHFVLYGEKDDVIAFLEKFKLLYSKYMRRKYGIKELLRNNRIDIQEASGIDETVEWFIAYVQMNSVAANISIHPSLYPWGTGGVFFNNVLPKGKRIGDISARARMRLFHSTCDALPQDWIVSEEGYILPQSYVDYVKVESIFRTPNRMNYFYTHSSKARKRIDSEENLPSFRDQIILSAIPELCRSLFKKNGFAELSLGEKTELLRQIRYRFSMDVAQMARVCGISYTEVSGLLDYQQ